jgi:endonuclease/exonuclease/phosphatase family metal-dependent hydrolase
MKIVSWNCGGWSCGGFNLEKFKEMIRYKPDILLIQECTKKEYDLVSDSLECEWYFTCGSILIGDDWITPATKHWYGDTDEESYKGIAIFSRSYSVELLDNFNKKFRYIVPYKISSFYLSNDGIKKSEEQNILLSVWTKQPSDGSQDYQKTIFDALDYYDFDVPIILAGDFNTGSKRENIHLYEELKTKLEKYGLKNCAQDTEYEYEPTFFHDKTNNYFTNDFFFISKNLNVYEFYVDKMNNQKKWHGLSGHYPIIANFANFTKEEVEEIDRILSGL